MFYTQEVSVNDNYFAVDKGFHLQSLGNLST